MRTRSLPGAGAGLLLLLSAPTWADPPDAAAPGPLTPEAAVQAALSVHPAVRQAEAELLQARGDRRAAALFLQNPQASGNTTLDAERANVTVTQPLSLTGEGWHARRAASARIDAAEAGLQRARRVAAADARHAYVDAVVAVGRVRVAEDGLALAVRLRGAVARQHEEGEAALLDLRLARLAEVQAAASLLEARGDEARALQALAEIVGREISAAALLEDPLQAAPDPGDVAPDERSDLVALRASLRAAEAALGQQRAAAVPPVGLGASVEREDGGTYVGPAVSVTLPLWDRNQRGRASARGELAVIEARAASLRARAATEVTTAARRVEEAAALTAALVADPVAEALAALDSIEAGYLAGQIDLPSAVLLQGEVLEGEAAAVSLLGRVAEARLDLLLATDDPALLGGAP